MMRAVRSGGGIEDGGAFASIERPRVVVCLAEAARSPVTLLVAPAGYGKSVAVRQYLASIDDPRVCFMLGAEHGTLLSFLRGLAQAAAAVAPDALATLSGAYERASESDARCVNLGLWMHAHLEAFDGVFVLDDFQRAQADADVARFVVELVNLSKNHVRWIISTRSTTGLPVATWLAYGESGFPVDERDLRFTPDEAREAARAFGLHMRDEELKDLIELTEGWATGLSFALRTSTRSADLRRVHALTREMIYRFLAEQVYEAFDPQERALLHVATALPAIDASVLELAGFDGAHGRIERLRARSAFLEEDAHGVYRCHDLFADFLRKQLALEGRKSWIAVHRRAALALESAGDVEHALGAHVKAASRADVLRLLEAHGEDLIERARGDAVSEAIGSLDDTSRRENPRVVALQGLLVAASGRLPRAEALLRRALALSGDDRDLRASIGLRLARLMLNGGGAVDPLLVPVLSDTSQPQSHRCEAYALLAAYLSAVGDVEGARCAMLSAQALLPSLGRDATRASTLLRLGIAAQQTGAIDAAEVAYLQAYELAVEIDAHGIVGRACSGLSNLMADRDDTAGRLAYAQRAVTAAAKAGDVRDREVALVQMLGAQMRSGDAQRCVEIEGEIGRISAGTRAFTPYVTQFRALRLAWEGRFGEAHRLLSRCWRNLHSSTAQAITGAYCALFLALDQARDESVEVLGEVVALAVSSRASVPYAVRNVATAIALCALAEAVNGRTTHADRILRQVPGRRDPVVDVTCVLVQHLVASLRSRLADDGKARSRIDTLRNLGYADVAGVFAAVEQHLRRRAQHDGRTVLTRTERSVLTMLAGGMRPKDVASQTGRSIFTIRAHVANVVAKLGCHGEAEAIAVARERGLIAGRSAG